MDQNTKQRETTHGLITMSNLLEREKDMNKKNMEFS